MPTDPRTGKSLPYPGEPGYEEAMAANPDVYAQEGMTADPAMMGQDPAMMGQDDGAPSADDLAMMEQDAQVLEQDVTAQTAPAPEKPFSVKAIGTMLDEFNNTIDAFAGDDIPDLEWSAPDGGKNWDQPLPQEVFVPLVALDESLKMIGGGGFYDKYGMDLQGLTSDPELRKATANLKKMGKDKKLIEAMQEPIVGDAEGMGDVDSMPPEPGMFDEDEQALAANMA